MTPKQKRCEYRHCKKTISQGHNRRRKFCNNACKQAEYRERKAANVTTPMTA